MKKIILVAILIFVLFFTAKIIFTSSSFVLINDKKIFVELAKTPEQKQKGLMYRNFLPINHGMLFIWDKDDNRSFWMKNTLIPLDIIFISKDFEINGILQAKPCKKETGCQVYAAKAMYVLEVNKDFTKNNNIKEGQKIKLVI